jgi:hypothetical protein
MYLPCGCLSGSFDCPVVCSFQRVLKINLPILKRLQFLLEIGYLFLDLAKLRLSFGLNQIVLTKLFSYLLLKLASQDPEVWVSPNRPISVFKFGRLDAFDDEVPVHTVLNLGCHVAKYSGPE